MELIRLNKASKIYKSKNCAVTAFSNLSLRVERGEFVAVTGASGSGKTTLMNVLGFLDVLTSGEYYFAQTDTVGINRLRREKMRSDNVGFVFQSFNLIPALSAMDNVMLPLIYRGVPRSVSKSAAQNALCEVGLENRMGHLPCQLSGGQQQRVAIARAIVHSPALILADEPTGNLDNTYGDIITDLLCSLNKKGHTVIMITHNLSLAKRADTVFNMANGRLN